MAKIVLVSPHVTPTTWQLTQALRAQQHEVILLSSYKEDIPDASGIEFMSYFKKWSMTEALRLMPHLFRIHPQVVHLLLEEDSLNPAQAVLATYAKAHPRCILTTSLLHIRRGLGRLNPARYLVEESDIITCPTIDHLAELRGLNVRSRRQGRGILPPVLNIQQNSLTAVVEDIESAHKIHSLLESTPYVVCPFFEKDFDKNKDYFSRLKILAQKYKLVLWSSTGAWEGWTLRSRKLFTQWMEEQNLGDRWLMLGPQTSMANILNKSEALILAGLALSPIEATDYFLAAIQNQATLILDSNQTSVQGGLWQNGVNCWILPQGFINDQLSQLLEKGKIKIPTATSAITQERQWLDHPMNELSRLYSRALDSLDQKEKNG